MHGDLALPLGHVPAAAAAAPPLRVCRGRPFRQPVNLPNSPNFSPGLELWPHQEDPDRKLFAMFNGELGFIAAPGAGLPHSLELNVSLRTQHRYNKIDGLLEPVPSRVVYENVNQALVETALRTLIQAAHTATVGVADAGAWHPSMRMQWNGTRLKEQLDAAHQGGTLNAEIGNVVSAITGAGHQRVLVLAGDHIGAAAARLATDPAPQNCAFLNARRVTLIVQEYAGNSLDPAYYLWRLLKNANGPASNRQVQVVTRAPLQPSNTFDHPLLTLINLDLDNTLKARVETNALMPAQAGPSDVLLFPTAKLSEWHGYKQPAHNRWRNGA